jgi:hypothetical protein
MRRLKSISLIIGLSLLILVSSFFLFRPNIVDFLSVNKPVDADCLVVEGWISENSLGSAAEEFLSNDYKKLIVTGVPIESWYMMAEDGFFVFDLEDVALVINPGDSIVINLRGTQAKGNYAHFSLYINNEKVGGGFTMDKWKDYLIVSDSVFELRTLTIAFDNDDFYGREDRNLFVGSLSIGNAKIPARSEKTFVFDNMDYRRENPVQTNFSSVAEIAAHSLMSLGIPKEKVVILPSKDAERNRTLNSAQAVNAWIQEYFQGDISLNIYSENIHSRRSWMVYKSVLKINNDKIGIILPIERTDNLQNIKINNRTILREILGIIYYSFRGLFLSKG